jgi:hypothetical protein
MQCPMCNPYGLLLILIGFTVILLSAFYNLLMYIGLVILVSAYIVPSIISRYTNKSTACKLPAKKINKSEELM